MILYSALFFITVLLAVDIVEATSGDKKGSTSSTSTTTSPSASSNKLPTTNPADHPHQPTQGAEHSPSFSPPRRTLTFSSDGETSLRPTELVSPPTLPSARFAVGGPIGLGTTAVVKEGTDRETGGPVAIKIFSRRQCKSDGFDIDAEAKLMYNLRHPNILPMIGVMERNWARKDEYCIVMDYAKGGDLFDYLTKKGGPLPDDEARKKMRQLADALHYLHHKMGVAHRDLKLENIMLDETRQNILLTDFGASKLCDAKNPMQTLCGTPYSMPPELLSLKHGEAYDGKAADMWSFGVLVFIHTEGYYPFDDNETPQGDERVEILKQAKAGLPPYVPGESKRTKACDALLRKILVVDPTQRATMHKLMVEEPDEWLNP